MPETRYVVVDGVHIAFQMLGDGPIDLIVVPGWLSHLELDMEEPLSRWFYEQLATFARVVRFDKAGTGLSDRVGALGGLENRVDEIAAVMDAVGSEHAALLGYSEGGTMAVAFAATHPDRVSSLVLYASHCGRLRGDPDFPCGYESDAVVALVQKHIEVAWGEGRTLELLAPSLAGSAAARSRMGRYERMAASPGAALAHLRMILDSDARPLLRLVQARTVVLHRVDDRAVPVCNGRYLSSTIPGAQYVEMPGDAHVIWLGDAGRIVDEVRSFLMASPGPVDAASAVATVVIVDLGGGTDADVDTVQLASTHVIERHGGERFDAGERRIGARFTGPARSLRCAGSIRDLANHHRVVTRTGVHAGECQLARAVTSSPACQVAAALADIARANEIVVSRTVRDLVVGADLPLVDRGAELLTGLDTWQCYSLAATTDAGTSGDLLAVLTPGEWPVARLVAQGLTNAAIAGELHLSRHTVESHLKHIFAKIGVGSRVELAVLVLSSAGSH